MCLTLLEIIPLYGQGNQIFFFPPSFFSLLPFIPATWDRITRLGMTSAETLLFPGSCLSPLQLNP